MLARCATVVRQLAKDIFQMFALQLRPRPATTTHACMQQCSVAEKWLRGAGVYREDIHCSQVDVLQHDGYLRVVE